MSRKLELSLTGPQHDALIAAREKARPGARSVTVGREALVNILLDYGVLLGALGREGVVISHGGST